MNSLELRQKFLDFFEKKGHKIIPSSSLLPQNDPSVLFTTAGMHPLVPYLLGEKHPLGQKLVDIQKCLRTDDINEIGDSQHLTFFEMLGYWSLGDYFKKDSIHYTFNFYVGVLGFDKEKICVTVFAGDETAPFDQESFNVWRDEIGIPEERIYRYGKNENWWGPVGEVGPCGPCTEMFIDTDLEPCGENCGPACSCDKFVEIGNNVFMEFNKTATGDFVPLKQKNVDVGLGFERLLMFSQNKNDVFETDLVWPIMQEIERLSGKSYPENKTNFRIIADHIRAAVFAINDGAIPSNKDRGYIVRRLIRRAMIKAQNINLAELANKVFALYDGIYEFDRENIIAEIEKEADRFQKTLTNGLNILKSKKTINGQDLFDLYQSYGLPAEIAMEEAETQGIEIAGQAMGEYAELFRVHQEKSRTASAGMFKGGLTTQSEQATKYHTATHLLLASLKQVLGQDVRQHGSNITDERLRFDFNWREKLTDMQLKKIESLVNEKIQDDLIVSSEEMQLEDARNCGAEGVFGDKYEDKVKVYSIGSSASSESPFSREICGGPHVASTGILGHFKIIKEEAVSSGVRRIKAILE